MLVAVIGGLVAPDARAQLLLLPDSPLGAHAMLFFNTPIAADRDVFSEAAAEGAGTVRLDIFMPELTQGDGSPNWTWVWRIKNLATRYRLRVLADLTGMPREWADCPAHRRVPSTQIYKCPTNDPGAWGALAGQVAARLKGTAVNFEIWNEPDGSWTSFGTPRQYGALLGAAVPAIHTADPQAHVTNGGMMETAAVRGAKWLRTALAAAGPAVWDSLWMLNVHIRGRERTLVPQLLAWRHFAAVEGRPDIPIWVTEAGYPANPAFQTDPSFRGGQPGQASYVAAALNGLYAAGAAKIFITQRDMTPSSGQYASEGVLGGIGDPVSSDPRVSRRSAFYSCQAFAQQHMSSSDPLGGLPVTLPVSVPSPL